MRHSHSAVGLLVCAAVLAGCGGGSSKTARAPSVPAKGPVTPVGTAGATSSTETSSSTAPATSTGGTPPPSREIAPGVVRSTVGEVTATMHAGTHHPRVNRTWPVSFEVTSEGRPVDAQVRYQYLLAGQVVARRSHYRFHGSFHDTFLWPSSAVGYPLTFRAVITATGRTLNLDYPIQVTR